MYIQLKYSALFVFLFNINFIQIIHFSIVYIDFSVPHYLFLAIALALKCFFLHFFLLLNTWFPLFVYIKRQNNLTDRVQILYDSREGLWAVIVDQFCP